MTTFDLANEKKNNLLEKKDTSFKSNPNKPNLIAHFFEFGFIIAILIYLIEKTIYHPNVFVIDFLATLIMFLILYFYLKRKNVEPSFVSISATTITFRSFPFFIKNEIELNNIKGFSLTKKPYFLKHGRIKKLYSSYIIYMNNGSKKLLIDYNFNNFKELNIKLKKSGVKYLGIDEPEWLGPRHKYKFD